MFSGLRSHERIPPRSQTHAMIGIFLHSRYLSCRLKHPSPFLSLCAQLRDVFRVEKSSRNRSDVCSGMFELIQRLVTPKYTMSQCEVIEYLSILLVYQNTCFFCVMSWIRSNLISTINQKPVILKQIFTKRSKKKKSQPLSHPSEALLHQCSSQYVNVKKKKEKKTGKC